jgi:hypothetical protein
MPDHASLQSMLGARQSTGFRLKIGKAVRMGARVDVTPVGPLAIGALVSAILLSVPPIIRAAAEVKSARRG